MPDRIDVLFPVLKLELLFLPGEQTRVDSWILDERAALHDACEPCLEQRLLHPISGSPARGNARVQLVSIAQGNGDD